MTDLTDRLWAGDSLSDDEWRYLIEGDYEKQALFHEADKARRRYYGTDVYIRGLIEISNFCRNDCLYCGIRRSNANVSRYRLTEAEILACCGQGYALGFRTFVLQGGEDGAFSQKELEELVGGIKKSLSRLRHYPVGGRAFPRELSRFISGGGRPLPASP